MAALSLSIFANTCPKERKWSAIREGVRVALDGLPRDTPCYMEDFAYGKISGGGSSSGTSLAEVAAVVRLAVYDLGFTLQIKGIGTVKKSFTGNGASTKAAMYKQFRELHPEMDLLFWFRAKDPTKKPVEDLVDAYAFARYPEDAARREAERVAAVAAKMAARKRAREEALAARAAKRRT